MEETSKLKIISFKNCELHCCHLDGYKEHRDAFLIRLSEIEKYFIEKPLTAKFRIWYNVDDTLLDKLLMDEIKASIIHFHSHIVKIAFIGLGRMQQRQLSKHLNSEKLNQSFPYAFFSDAEKAKEWLI